VTRLDPRLVFLARAGARHTLVEYGEMTLDEALAAGLIDGLECCPLCGLRRHLLAEKWERTQRFTSASKTHESTAADK
jgi:hypothetical protein